MTIDLEDKKLIRERVAAGRREEVLAYLEDERQMVLALVKTESGRRSAEDTEDFVEQMLADIKGKIQIANQA